MSMKVVSALFLLFSSFAASVAEEDASSSGHLTGEKLLDLCRRFPTWRDEKNKAVSWETCMGAWGYNPRDTNLLKYAREGYQGDDDQEWIQVMYTCMAEKAKERHATVKETVHTPAPRVSSMYPDQEEPMLVVVDFALNEEEAATFKDLHECVKHHHPHQFVRRSFADEYAGESIHKEGGNDCTFVGGFMQLFAPGVMAQMCRVQRVAWESAEWAHIQNAEDEDIPWHRDPCKVGMRTAEFISYDHDGWSKLGGHTDIDTMYTIIVALSEASSFVGGENYFKFTSWGGEESSAKLLIKPNRLQALVFLGGTEFHGIERIFQGRREAMAIELWQYGDAPLGINRPQTYEYDHFRETGSYKGTLSHAHQDSYDPTGKIKYEL